MAVFKGNKMKNLLLASTAVVLLSSATPGFAQGVGSGAWVSVEGGVAAISTGYDSYMYSVESTDPDAETIPGTGINMFFEVGINIPNTPYSVGLGFRNSSNGSSLYESTYDSFYSSYDTSDSSNEGSFTTLDFEIGRDIGLGGVGSGRVTLGVRGAQVGIASSGYYSDYYSSGYNSQSASFIGAGPRVALEASVPVMNRVSFDAEVGVAMLFGTTTSSSDSYSYGGGPSGYSIHGPSRSSSDTSSSTVTNIDFSAALSYLIGSNSKVSLGYRSESFTGLNLGGYGYADTMTDQGAFLKFTTGF
ncbi:MAG: hypothetical protein JKY41_03320 [Rhodobacteraceae bacterium]|nr:hypothetical protein [Paracoccaceae bacterium]